MNSKIILDYLKKHGQKSDRQISKDTKIPLTEVWKSIGELQTLKKIYICQATIFEEGVKVEYSLCRLSGFSPPAALPNRFYTNRGVNKKRLDI